MGRTCSVCGTTIEGDARVCTQCGALFLTEAAAPAATPVPSVGKRAWVIRIGVVVAAVAGLWAFYGDAFRSYHPVIASQPEVSAPASSGRSNSTLVAARLEGPFIIVSLADLRERRIVRFFDPESVQTVPMLAYLTSSGRVVTAMSISENCRSRDFYLDGENIHCANCPSYWNASSLEAYACCQKYYPDPIPSTVLGDEVRIEAVTARQWQTRS
ncbi:MAG: Fe-S-containing protein [Bacteroidetes bacterium]|nr:Fe-S-containing protein [Bacteroidota bacterium]